MKYFTNFSLLRHNRNYRLLYSGQFISFFGTAMTGVALPYQVYHETHSTLMVGLLSLFQLLPLLITALLGGVLADRHNTRRLLIITEVFLALCSIALALNATFLTHTILILFLVAPAMSAMTGLQRPAIDSIVQLILTKKDFADVGALTSFLYGFCFIVGPALGGLIIAHFGVVATFVIDGATFVISLISVLLIKNIPQHKKITDQSTLTALKSGFKYAASRQELLGTYLVDFSAMVFGMPTALFPAIAMSFGGAKTLGLLYSAPAIGSLLMSFVSGWTNQVKRHGLAIAIAASLWGVSIILFGLSTNVYLAIFFLIISGALDTISGLFRGIIWNQTIPNEFRGRLSGIEMISYLSGPKLGDTEAGLVAAAFGITTSIVSGGILCIVGVAVCCYFLPKFISYKSEH